MEIPIVGSFTQNGKFNSVIVSMEKNQSCLRNVSKICIIKVQKFILSI